LLKTGSLLVVEIILLSHNSFVTTLAGCMDLVDRGFTEEKN